jgi:hypothetical protein
MSVWEGILLQEDQSVNGKASSRGRMISLAMETRSTTRVNKRCTVPSAPKKKPSAGTINQYHEQLFKLSSLVSITSYWLITMISQITFIYKILIIISPSQKYIANIGTSIIKVPIRGSNFFPNIFHSNQGFCPEVWLGLWYFGIVRLWNCTSIIEGGHIKRERNGSVYGQ